MNKNYEVCSKSKVYLNKTEDLNFYIVYDENDKEIFKLSKSANSELQANDFIKKLLEPSPFPTCETFGEGVFKNN